MIEAPAVCLVDLFSAVSAHLRGSPGDVDLILRDAVDRGAFSQLPIAAAITAGEYLRDAAEERSMSPQLLLDILCRARGHLAPQRGVDPAALVLLGVRGYLGGTRPWWTSDQMADLCIDPMDSARACVQVVAAALTWKAEDVGIPPQTVASSVCLGLAARGSASAA